METICLSINHNRCLSNAFTFILKNNIFLFFFNCVNIYFLCKVGNHINVQDGKWTALDAGIGGGVDSYFEYLVKGSILFQEPKYLKMFKGMWFFHSIHCIF